MSPTLSAVRRYHDGTKHHFHQFARSLGYLDWASQPHPFRRFAGAAEFVLFPAPAADTPAYVPRPVFYERLFGASGSRAPIGPRVSTGSIGDLLRHSLGLSAWKAFRESRWSLRVNPSSGNLHPTEAYIVCGPMSGLADLPAVYHYGADRHALEKRCTFDPHSWSIASADREVVLVALTSIHWREAWKYGERAFRYCQHDLGHAVAAISLAAAAVGWRASLLPAWSHRMIAAATGIDRDEDFVDAEREEPACILAVGDHGVSESIAHGGEGLGRAIAQGQWAGHANRLSEDHVQWTFIDEVAAATADPGRPDRPGGAGGPGGAVRELTTDTRLPGLDARRLILQRRSAVAFDGRSSVSADVFFAMLSRVLAGDYPPWNGLWWTPRVHLAIFVHRVEDLEPGLYLLPRASSALERLRVACGRDFLWEPVENSALVPLMRLARGDCRRLAGRVSCDQDIAADGFFSLGMIAEFDASLDELGPSFYRHLFWESGVIGQVLYLEAEAAGARATGIGCFFDDPVHDVLGLQGHAFQSLYHFTVGVPVEDTRLTTEKGYGWEA